MNHAPLSSCWHEPKPSFSTPPTRPRRWPGCSREFARVSFARIRRSSSGIQAARSASSPDLQQIGFPDVATITFLGAAQTVTGSKYLLETPTSKVLVDAGLFQGLKALRE